MSGRSCSILIAGIASMSALLLPAGREACAQQVALTNTRALDFGRIVAVGAGTVVVSPNGGRPQGTGVIVLNSGTPGPATFSVGGNAGRKSVMITFPNASTQLKSGANTMTVDTFTSSPAANNLVTPAAAAIVSVGATLHVAAAQAPGAYNGTFSLTVNFQ